METRAHYPAGPGTTYELIFCDGVKVCDDVERIAFVADSDEAAAVHAKDLMQGRPRNEVGDLHRPVGRGHAVWVASFADGGARSESESVHAEWELHREFHGCGGAR